MFVRRSALIAAALVALVPLMSAAGLSAAQEKPAAASVAGKWQTSLEMEVGTSTVVLVFKQDGEKLTGTYTGRYGEYPLSGTVKDGALDFVVTINAEGTETRMHFVGKLTETPQGTQIRGTANLGGMGEAGWIARRQS